ncbi:MAG TPA: hypothetical protein VGE40_10970 [Bacilli bacterium]
MSEKSKNQGKEKKQQVRAYDDMEGIEEEFLGLNEPEVFIDFVRLVCGCIDPVPEFIIDEFSWDLKKGEEVEMCCPKCNGTMIRKKEKKKD